MHTKHPSPIYTWFSALRLRHDSEAYDLCDGQANLKFHIKIVHIQNWSLELYIYFSRLLFIYFRNTPLEFTWEITACCFTYLQSYQILAINWIQVGWLHLYIYTVSVEKSMRLSNSLIVEIFFSQSTRLEHPKVLGMWRRDVDKIKQRSNKERHLPLLRWYQPHPFSCWR